MLPKNSSHYGSLLYSAEGISIIDCEVCSFKHIYPLPNRNEIDQLYKEEYYEKAQPEYIDRVKADAEWWSEVYKERVVQIEEFFDKDKEINTLDIGSGPGYYLKEATEKGWKALGIEPSKNACQYAKSLDLNIVNSFFTIEEARKLEKFDVIHMNNVLEHMSNPIEIIQLVWDKLNENGVLCVAVPNDFNIFQNTLHEKYNYKPWWISPKEHLNYFSFETLRNLLENNGFDVLKETTNFPMELFLMMDENYIEDSKLGRECHKKRKSFEMKLFENNLQKVKANFYESLASNGLGREVIIYARKR